MTKKVFVAMSGGVDSSVAAALMKRAGFNVVGVFMKPWSPEENVSCLWKQDREDALRVAAKLNIPLLTWDLSKEYEKHVAEYMISGYRQGITPNPDVMCNKFIKFGVFLDKAMELGADYIATGHYVKKLKIKNEKLKINEYKLLKARDLNKDQSYFLYTLTQKQLKHCLFPIGDYIKDKVRQLAKKFGLPNWDKPDSQGVCFVGPMNVDEFLKSRIRPKNGLVIEKNSGRILGEHDGVWFYTVGQRHGFNLSAGKPYYIVAKDIKKNILYVDGLENSKFEILQRFRNESQAIRRNLRRANSKQIQMTGFNWINGHKDNLPLVCKVKTRYRQKDISCTIIKNGSSEACANLKESNIPIAPGQSAVFYRGDEVLGGGVIA